ncbi:MAG TPA: MBL fold metallo-hydrolase [Ignavibacteriaceae bacterium]
MKIKFLGTGSAKTSLNRYHSSLLISSSNHNLLVDCGDGISRAILNQNVDFNTINSILISHFHADHFSGLPSLLTQMKLLSRKSDLSIFVHSSEKIFLEDFIFHSYLFTERMNFNLNIVSFDEEKEVLLFDDLTFTSKLNSHLDKYKLYDHQNRLSCTSLSFLFKDDENSCIFSGDVGSELDLYLFDQKVEFYITEITHINPLVLINLLHDQKTEIIVMTHLDDETEEVIKVFDEELQKSYEKSHILAAFDGLELNQST